MVHGQAAHASGSGSGSVSGRCSIWQLLVEQLMVNSSMGQATVLQHIDATHNHKLHPCLQQAVSGYGFCMSVPHLSMCTDCRH